jgi:hypothetical protein
MEKFLKSVSVRRTLWFLWILRIWPMKCLCILYCTYKWLVRIHGIGNWACLLGFDSKCSINLMLWFWETNLTKDDFWESIDLWILMDIWYHIYGDDWWCIFVWQLYVACVVDVVGNCIYVMWWWIVVNCIYTSFGDGEVIIVCVNICICSWVICSCIHDWWWWILYPIEVITMFLLHRRWRPWGVWYHMHLDESRDIA